MIETSLRRGAKSKAAGRGDRLNSELIRFRLLGDRLNPELIRVTVCRAVVQQPGGRLRASSTGGGCAFIAPCP